MSDDPIDLFASLRPDDETLAASDRDAIWARLSGQPAPTGATDEIDIVDALAEAGRRRRVLAIAAALVLAILVVATRRDGASDGGGSTPATTAPTTFRPTTTGATGPPTTSLLTAPPTDPASNGATTLPSFTADPTVPLTPDAVPWYLPTWLPDGTELWVVHSQPVIDPGFGILSQAHWVKRGPDGRTVVADVHLYVSEGGADDAGSNATVHGAPGRVVRSSSDHRSASVSWNEGQHSWEPSAQGIDGDALLRIAEASTVHSDTSTLNVEESSGLETVPAPTSAASTAMGSSTTAGRYGSGSLDQWVNIRVEAARAGETLDDTSGVESRRVTIDGIERSIVDDPPDGASLGHRVRWYADGHVVTVLVKRRLDRADLQRLISGIHPASAGEVDAARGVVSASGLAAPVVDSATTADGTVVSIRGASGGVHYACASIDDRSGCVVGSETRQLESGEHGQYVLQLHGPAWRRLGRTQPRPGRHVGGHPPPADRLGDGGPQHGVQVAQAGVAAAVGPQARVPAFDVADREPGDGQAADGVVLDALGAARLVTLGRGRPCRLVLLDPRVEHVGHGAAARLRPARSGFHI